MSKCIYLAIDGWCNRLAGTPCDKVCEDSAEKPCKDKVEKVVTNADRIRNMTVEELAKFLQEDVFYEPWCPDDVVCIIGEGCQLTDKDCSKCALKWLKQEAAE